MQISWNPNSKKEPRNCLARPPPREKHASCIDIVGKNLTQDCKIQEAMVTLMDLHTRFKLPRYTDVMWCLALERCQFQHTSWLQAWAQFVLCGTNTASGKPALSDYVNLHCFHQASTLLWHMTLTNIITWSISLFWQSLFVQKFWNVSSLLLYTFSLSIATL